VGLPIAASLIALLLLIFTMAIAINLARGRRFACNCFGDSKMAIGPAVLLRNLIVVAEPSTVDELVEHHQQLLSDGITILQETEGGVLQQ